MKGMWACGPYLERHVAGIRQFEAAGFAHLALVQVGADTQASFIRWAATQLLPAPPTGFDRLPHQHLVGKTSSTALLVRPAPQCENVARAGQLLRLVEPFDDRGPAR